MNIYTERKKISDMSDDELKTKFDLYNELESIDSKTNVIIELMAQELDKRDTDAI